MSRLTDAAVPNRGPGRPCSAAEARAQLDPESAADFDAWMVGALPMSDAEMWVALQALGFRVAKSTLGHHRRRHCRCAGVV